MKVFLINLFKYSYYEVYLQYKSNPFWGIITKYKISRYYGSGLFFFLFPLFLSAFILKMKFIGFFILIFPFILFLFYEDKLINFENIETEINQFYLNNSLHRQCKIVLNVSLVISYLILTLIFILNQLY